MSQSIFRLTIAEFVREINHPNFMMCLDTGHANLCKDWHTPAAAIREFSDLIKVLHVHDNKGKLDEHAAPFFGEIDWIDFSSALQETDFSGVISLECAPTEKLPRDIRDDMYSIYCRIAKAIAK